MEEFVREELSSSVNDFADEVAESKQLLTRYPVGHSGHNRRTVAKLYPLWRDASVSDQEFFHWLLLWSRSVVCYRCRLRDDEKRMDSIAGDAAANIFRSAKNFENRSRFTSWAYTIIRRAIGDYWRRTAIVVRNGITYSLDGQLETLSEKFEGSYDGTSGGGEHRYEHPGQQLHEIEREWAVDLFLAKLGPVNHQLITAKLDGAEDSEIAAELGVSVDRVKKQYSKLKTHLDKRIPLLRKVALPPLPERLIYEEGQLTTDPCANPPLGQSTEIAPSNSPASKPFASIKPGRATRASLEAYQRITAELRAKLMVSPVREAWIRAAYPLFGSPTIGWVESSNSAARPAHIKDRVPEDWAERQRKYLNGLKGDNGARFSVYNNPLLFPVVPVKTPIIQTKLIVRVFEPKLRRDDSCLSREKFKGCASVT
jgi:RNA polymerase sigma factor (sigma-70 family)